MTMRLSLIDFATIHPDQPVGEALADSVRLARAAEETGRFERIWYAEHHNMPTIASSATSVLIAHVAAHTSTIRLGSGGIMLPNHSPLVIAEQFGTLAALHPGRIDLGLGRAPGTGEISGDAIESLGWLMAELGELAVCCFALAASCREHLADATPRPP